MTKAKELSPTMLDCLKLMGPKGLERYQGGFWAPPGTPWGSDGVPRPYHGTSTVEALIKRGAAHYTGYREGARGKFPILVEVVKP